MPEANQRFRLFRVPLNCASAQQHEYQEKAHAIAERRPRRPLAAYRRDSLVWIGHNWANVVNHPVYRPVLPHDPPEAARAVFLAASKREHGVFRYASLVVLGDPAC